MADPSPPKMAYWHVYTNADGVSEQKRFELTAFQLQSVGGRIGRP